MIIDNLNVEKFIEKRRLKNDYRILEYRGFKFFIGKSKKLDKNGNSRYYVAIFKDNFNITSMLRNKQVFCYTKENYGITNGMQGLEDYSFLDFIILSLEEL